uniref:Uncharacterized protein n=1 Tax=Anguilla anguilla TaxID=7936 RepID=A0A0E9USC8_ANGAN
MKRSMRRTRLSLMSSTGEDSHVNRIPSTFPWITNQGDNLVYFVQFAPLRCTLFSLFSMSQTTVSWRFKGIPSALQD